MVVKNENNQLRRKVTKQIDDNTPILIPIDDEEILKKYKDLPVEVNGEEWKPKHKK